MKQEELNARIKSITAVHTIPNHPGAKSSAREIEADQVRSLVRDVVEAVKPARQGGSATDNAQEAGHDQAIDEMEFKMEELGL